MSDKEKKICPYLPNIVEEGYEPQFTNRDWGGDPVLTKYKRSHPMTCVEGGCMAWEDGIGCTNKKVMKI